MKKKKYKPIHLSRDQLEKILSQLGVKIVSETAKDLLCYCPFHRNVDTPALNFEKTSPYRWRCQNAKCGKTGNIFSMITKKGYTVNEARHMLFSNITSIDDFEKLMQELLSEDDSEENVWEEFDVEKFRQEDQESDWRALNYVKGRGITGESYYHFKMGYSSKKDMLVIPVFDERQTPIGVIGRSIEDKQYRYSSGLQRGKTIFNINDAITYSINEIILTEGALDSIYIFQAGYLCVGAVLGSAISEDQWKLLRKYFTDIICFFDNDDAGIALTDSVIKSAHGMGVSVVEYPDDRDVKDPGDLTREEIIHMIENKVSAIEILLGD